MFINSEYKVEAKNNKNICLMKRSINKKGDEVWKTIGNYPKVQDALKDIITMEINGTGFDSFITIVKKIDELYEMIEKLDVKVCE